MGIRRRGSEIRDAIQGVEELDCRKSDRRPSRRQYIVRPFWRGGAITHCAVLSGKWQKVVYNELDPVVFQGFQMAIQGKFKNENRWISRSDFFRLRRSDPYVAMCFSFGNDLKTYCYGRDIEKYKKMIHEIVYGDTPRNRLKAYKHFMKECKKIYRNWTLESLERLERLQSLERLERLQSLGHLELSNCDYADVELSNCDYVIYCDIPYKGTNAYNQDFDYDRFYTWARRQKNIYISSYEMPDDFECIATIPRRGNMSAVNKDGIKQEKIFIPTED